MSVNRKGILVARIAVAVTLVWSSLAGAQEDVLLDAENAGLAALVKVAGPIESTSGGFVFPDGSVQTTAAIDLTTEVGSLSANLGIYNNRIIDIAPERSYTEICVKKGAVAVDVHVLPIDHASTAEGECSPGDIGWIIEHEERTAEAWDMAKMECLVAGMRLPEVFEYVYSCKNNDSLFLSLDGMIGNHEWASNSATVMSRNIATPVLGSAIPTIGLTSCTDGDIAFVARSDSAPLSLSFRCVR